MDLPLYRIYQEELARLIQSKVKEEGFLKTSIDSLSLYKATQPSEFLNIMYEPSICIIAQGSKAVGLNDEMLSYNSYSYLLASVHLPARVKIQEASKENPYLSLKLTFSMEQIFDVIKNIDDKNINFTAGTTRGLCISDMSIKLLEPILRLIRLLESPSDIPVLSPLIIKEILYIIIRDRGGDFIRQYIKDGSAAQRVASAIAKIKHDLKEDIDIQALAKSIGMSESSLYHHFKKITMMSPLQFQKNLRLQEARQMLLTQDIEASQVAFEVGYESPSQFSREYSRMFGLPPKTHIRNLRN